MAEKSKPSAIGAAPSDGVAPDGHAALRRLMEGNRRYVDGTVSHPNQGASRRAEIAVAQHPFAVILGCSDSRVAAEILFDQGLGDLFVVRVAGNGPHQTVIESVDFAVRRLGVRLVFVLGHARCGAVLGAIDTHEKDAQGVPAIISDIWPAVAAAKTSPGDLAGNAVDENVRGTVARLRNCRELAAQATSGAVVIAGGRYDLASGKVEVIVQ